MSNIAELRQKAKLPANKAGGTTVQAFFQQNKQSIAAVLPKHVNADRMLKIALGAMRTTPKLMECTTESLFGAVVQCSQLGLEPNTPMGHAYLIPFGNRKAGRTDVQVIIGYRGLIDLARRSGQIVSIAAHAVKTQDEFTWEYGLDEKLSHRPAQGERGEITHFYAVAKLKDGGHAFEVMGCDDVNKIKNESLSKLQDWQKKKSPWVTAYEEMGRKTVIRRLFKYLPVSIELATATALDGAAESGDAQNLDGVLNGEYAVVDDSPYMESESHPEQATDQQPAANESQQTRPDQKPEQEQEPAAQQETWPQRGKDDDTGEEFWIDSAGEFYDESRHGWSKQNRPAVNNDGTFRARRGATQADDNKEVEFE